MFDIGFSELFVILLVGLLVIGPERLPKVARTLGALFGRLQRYVNDVKADISREVELEELRKMKSEFEDAARSVEKSVHDELRTTEDELNRSIAPPGSTVSGGATSRAPETAAPDASPAPSSPDPAPAPQPSRDSSDAQAKA
jgi:sec-independent protein translocase protein TatB